MVALTGIETALLSVGRAVVTPFFRHHLGARKLDRERSLPLSDLLRQRAPDAFSRRGSERQIDSVVDEVGKRLQPLIRTRFASLPENEAVAALSAVADTFDGADLTDDAVFAADVDPGRLVVHLRGAAPEAGLSELGLRLYDVALEDCARCFTEFVVQTAPFMSRAQVEILARLSEVTDLMTETVQKLALAVPDSGADFLTRYRDFLTKKLNTLELVGLDTQYRPRTALSVAYISLAVTGDGAPSRPQLPRWDPGLLRHARLDGNGSERVEQALSHRTRTLIRGEAGAGKSTLLRWLAVTAAANGFTGALAGWNGRIPFLIKLRSWPDTLPAPEQFLVGVADPIAGAMPGPWVSEQLRAGRALLLVDGVDELPAERRPRVRAWLQDLLTAYPDMLVVVTSRPPAAPVRWLEAEDFDALTLERLSPADVRALIDQWHRAARTSPALPCSPSHLARYEQALLTQLAANRHLYRLAGNPLMAAMLCALNLDRETHLPPDRMGIYKAAVDMLLHKRDHDRGVQSPVPELTIPEGLQLLQDLAWRISLNNRSELPVPEAEEYLSRRMAGMHRLQAAPAEVLRHLIERSGILREPAVGRVDFVHRTFQEYLAAREAAEQNMAGLLVTHAHLDTWREIVIMAAGLGNSPMRTDLIRGVLDRAAREPRRRRTLVLLAAACLETMPALEPPPLLAELENALGELLPPRNRAEARSLFAVGEPLLGRLPTDLSGLTEAQAAAVVDTVALINGPRALGILAGYATDERGDVQDALVRAWSYFDPDEYARQVLAETRWPNGHLQVERPALLAAAVHLRHVTDIRLDSGEQTDLDRLTGDAALTALSLSKWQGSLRSLVRFPRLTELSLYTNSTPIQASDVARLRDLDLTALTLFPVGGVSRDFTEEIGALSGLTSLSLALSDDARALEPLAGLSHLQDLGLYSGRVDSFRVLTGLPVRRLTLYNVEPPDGGWRDLVETFPGLTSLNLLGGQEWPEKFDFPTGFTSLEGLHLWHQAVDGLPRLGRCDSLRSIYLGFNNDLDVSPLLAQTQLILIDLTNISKDPDISCFSAWTGGNLTIRIKRRVKLDGLGPLPPTVRIRRV